MKIENEVVVLQLTEKQFRTVQNCVATLGAFLEMQGMNTQEFDALKNVFFRAAADYNEAVSA